MGPARTALLLILDLTEYLALLDPVNHRAMYELMVNELVVTDAHAQPINLINRILIPLLSVLNISILQPLKFSLEPFIGILLLLQKLELSPLGIRLHLTAHVRNLFSFQIAKVCSFVQLFAGVLLDELFVRQVGEHGDAERV